MMLEARNLSVRFGGLAAVDDVSLAVARGKIVALIGPNGAGKTTLFNLVSGFISPDHGRVELEGRDITRISPHEACRLGMARTFQIVQPFGAQTVRENIAVGAHLHHGSRADALRAAEAVGERVGLAAHLDKLAASNKEKLDWRHSIIDLMKLLNLDSSLAARKELAEELHFTGDKNDSASMNIWLHKQVMVKLAENGGKVPDELRK